MSLTLESSGRDRVVVGEEPVDSEVEAEVDVLSLW